MELLEPSRPDRELSCLGDLRSPTLQAPCCPSARAPAISRAGGHPPVARRPARTPGRATPSQP
jgi:hypothetical protein